jgi:(1->4)-alpha-D-glucan 1-alpha-D-glucosylmutase
MHRNLRKEGAPSPDEEALIYQTLLGAWPFDPGAVEGFRERVAQFLTKALREAKLHSNWLAPDAAYEEAVVHFAASLTPGFQKSFEKLWQFVAYHGAWNSLSQLIIKITAPGVPDFYQGTEMWAFQLVDPDNRGPVDYVPRRDALTAIRQAKPRSRRAMALKLAREWQDGRIKIFVTDAGLNFRRERSALFSDGEYVPLDVAGQHKDSVFAFARKLNDSWSITVAPRLTTKISGARGGLGANANWAKTRLQLPEGAPKQWTNIFTGRTVDGGLSLDSTLDSFPVAILFNAPEEADS